MKYYSHAGYGRMAVDDTGDWVRRSDYDRLKKYADELREQVNRERVNHMCRVYELQYGPVIGVL